MSHEQSGSGSGGSSGDQIVAPPGAQDGSGETAIHAKENGNATPAAAVIKAAVSKTAIPKTPGTKAKGKGGAVPVFSAGRSTSKKQGRSSPPPRPGSVVRGSCTQPSTRSGLFGTPMASSWQASTRTPGTRGGTVTRSALKGLAERAPVASTSARKAGAGGDEGPVASKPTPRQAAISAKKELEDQKRRRAVFLKQQQEEMKSAAKAKQAELAAEQQRILKERAERAREQRLAKASAKKAAKEKQLQAQAMELQAKREEQREHQERLARQEKARRRQSLAERSAAWERERQLKRRQREDRRQEQQVLMEGQEIFRQAKNLVKEEQERTDRLERAWRANRAHLDRSLGEMAGDRKADEACELRADRLQDQAALDRAAAEEQRLRRTSAQWRRNKKLLDQELERGAGKGMNPSELADELFQRAESRKEDAEYREAQEALRRQSLHRRRRSDLRRKHVGEALKEQERDIEADLNASREEGRMDVAAYRQECLRRERESLEGRRQKFLDDKALDAWRKELEQEAEAEDRELKDLTRQDIQAHGAELQAAERAEAEYRRQEQVRDRLYKEDEELRVKEQEAEERRIMLEDRESVSASKWREDQAELDRLEALRDTSSDKTKLEILEAIWARQSHPAASAAAKARARRSRSRGGGLGGGQPDLPPVTEEAEADTSGGGGGMSSGGGRRRRSSSGSSSSSSGIGIKGRDSPSEIGFGSSDDDSILGGWPGSGDDEDDGILGGGGGGRATSSSSFMGQSAIGLGGNVRLAEEDDGEGAEEEDASRSWIGILNEGDASNASLVELSQGQEGGGDGEAERTATTGRAPAWGDVSVIEEQDAAAAAAAPTCGLMTASALDVLAAADQSFATTTDSPGDEEAAVVAEAAVGSKGDGDFGFPVRMLLFSEERQGGDDAEEDKEEQGGGLVGSVDKSNGCKRIAATVAAVADAAAADAVPVAGTLSGDESGVLMMSRTEAEPSASEYEEDAQAEEVGALEDEEEELDDLGVVSFDESEGCGDGGDGGGRESSILGMVRAVRAEEAACDSGANAGADKVTDEARAEAEPLLEEDSALASLDGNEGSQAAPAADKTVGSIIKEQAGVGGKDGGPGRTLTKVGEIGDGLASVAATPVTPDAC